MSMHTEEGSGVTTRTMAMSMSNEGGDRERAAPLPIFASSWMALYLMLKREFESLRDDAADAEAPPARVDKPN